MSRAIQPPKPDGIRRRLSVKAVAVVISRLHQNHCGKRFEGNCLITGTKYWERPVRQLTSARQIRLQFPHYFLRLRLRQLDTEFLNLTLDIKADSATR
jgi:hypothetical protein